jgi:hypothetical protein
MTAEMERSMTHSGQAPFAIPARARSVSLGAAAGLGLLLALAGASSANAQTAGSAIQAKSEAIAPPATKLKTAALVAPADARTYFTTATTHTVGLSGSGAASPEIAVLAKSLVGGRNVQTADGRDAFARNVLDYVRNNIGVEFRYGLSKGGVGALIDQSGTPFDQAELMVLLLAQGGVSSSYVTGEATLTPAQFGFWTGLVQNLDATGQTFTVNAKAACELLADGGVPAVVNNASSCSGLGGALSGVTVSHIWVQVAGVNYDPSFKAHVLRAGIDVPAAMGCGTQSASTCGSTVSSAGMSGASQSTTAAGVAFIADYNLAAAKSAHDGLKANLAGYIKTHNLNGQGLNASITDVLGGKELGPQSGSVAPLSYAPAATWIGGVPDSYRTKLKVKVNPSVCGAFFADEIAGRALVYKRNIIAGADVFAVDGQPISNLGYAPAGTCGAIASPYVQIEVDHPYPAQGGAYGDDVVNFKPVDPPSDETGGNRRSRSSYLYYEGGIGVTPRPYVAGQQSATDWPEQNYLSVAPVMIVHGFGQAGLSAQKSMSDRIAVAPSSQEKCAITTINSRPTARVCNYDQHAVVAETFASMRTLMDKLVDGVGKTVTTRHHDVGLVYAGRASGLALMTVQESLSIAPASGVAADRQAAFDMNALALSEAESRSNAIDSAPGISAARAFFAKGFSTTLTGKAGKVYDISPAQMASYVAALPKQASVNNSDGTVSYGSYCINYLDAMGTAVAAPGCWRHLALQDVANQGYSTLIMEGGQGELFYNGTAERAFTLWEYVKGGTTIGDGLKTAIKTTELIDQASLRRKFLSVSPSSGDLTFSPGADIVTGAGDFPASLPLLRTFSPAAKEGGRNTGSFYGGDGGVASLFESTAVTSSGPDSQYHDRLGAGWTHNYQVRLVRSNDLSYQLGSENAFFASEMIANLQIIRDLGVSGSLQNKLASIFAINNMDRTTAGYLGGTYNTIAVMKGAAATTFHLMFNGEWVAATEPEARLNATLTKYTSRTGEEITFSPYRYDDVTVNTSGNSLVGATSGYDSYRILKADRWSFPNGMAVDFQYDAYVLSNPPGCPPQMSNPQYNGQYGYLLKKVSNNLGRELNFEYDNQWVRQTISQPCKSGYEEGVIYPGYVYTAVNFSTYRLKKVTDEDQRSVTFALDNGSVTVNANTFTVTDPMGYVTQYGYEPAADSPAPAVARRRDYQLRRWFSPRDGQHAYQAIRYDDLNRVVQITDRNGNLTKYYPSGLFGSELWKRTDLVDGVGNVTTLNFDEKNGNTLIRNPLGAVTLNKYDNASRLISSIMPEGNEKRISYDIRGNVTQTCLLPKSPTHTGCSRALGDIVTSTSYVEGETVINCTNLKTCNSPASETDAMSGVVSYSWDPDTGELLQKKSPADEKGVQPQIDLVYTPYGPSGSTFVLLTTKTEKISSGSSVATNYEYDASNHYVLKSVTVDTGGLNIRTCVKFDARGNLTGTTDPRSGSCP